MMKRNMRNIKFLVLISILFLAALQAAAQAPALVERVVEVKTGEKNPSLARTQLMNMAADKVSEELIKEIIGEQKVQKNRSMIMAKIVRKSASFLPFSKAGELQPVQGTEGFQMSVTLRANLDQLQALLLENGLFYDSDLAPAALPLIKWQDRVNSRGFAWWTESEPNFLSQESRVFEKSLQDAFLKSGFFVLRPQTFAYEDMLPREQRLESPPPDQIANWAQVWNAQILIQGHVQMLKGERTDAVQLDIRLTAVQALNNRVIAEVARKFETEPGAFEAVLGRKLKEVTPLLVTDLAAQVLEAWKQGTINSQLYRLKIAGKVSLPMQEGIKEGLRSKVREIKSVKERLISADTLVYEIDSSLTPPEIAKKLGELDLQGLKLVLDSVNEKEIVLKVKR
ncbi:MAG: hypothetical protein ACK5P7_08250 [Bdellovibrio sp.]